MNERSCSRDRNTNNGSYGNSYNNNNNNHIFGNNITNNESSYPNVSIRGRGGRGRGRGRGYGNGNSFGYDSRYDTYRGRGRGIGNNTRGMPVFRGRGGNIIRGVFDSAFQDPGWVRFEEVDPNKRFGLRGYRPAERYIINIYIKTLF